MNDELVVRRQGRSVKSRPLTRTVCLSLTNSNCSTDAPVLACYGKPFFADTTISRAAAVSRLTTPVAMSFPSSTQIASLCPTPLALWVVSSVTYS